MVCGSQLTIGTRINALLVLLICNVRGCTHAPPEPFITGAEVPAPHGWIDYCNRNPLDEDCDLTSQDG